MTFRKLIIMMLALSACPAARAFDFQYGGIYYNILGNGSSVEVTYPELNAGNYAGTIEIPAKLNYMFKEYTVRGIGRHAFFNCQQLERVTLPEGIVYINNQAFSRCFYMTEINLPSTLQRIQDSAFEYCEDLKSIVIPARVSEMGYAVFYDCRSITAYEVEDGNTALKAIDGVLFNADGSIMVQYPAGRQDAAFEIGEGVKQVTDYCFSPAPRLERVSIGADVEDILPATFAEAPLLESIEVSAENGRLKAIDGVLFDAEGSTLKQYPLGRGAKAYEVPEGVTELAAMSFAGSRKLNELTLPESLQRVDEFALTAMPALAMLKVKAQEPPEAVKNALGEDVMAGSTLYVPAQAMDAYKKAEYWSAFARISDLESASIDEVGMSDSMLTIAGGEVCCKGAISIFSASGRKIAQGRDRVALPDRAGLYIVKTDCGSRKVTVR